MNPEKVFGELTIFYNCIQITIIKDREKSAQVTNGLMKKSKRKSKSTSRQIKTKNMIIQNLWDTIKAILRKKFMAIQSYLKKQEKSQMNKLMLHIKQLDKEEQAKPKVSRRKEIIKMREEINEQ